jgi:hypothetical protein
MGLGEVPVRQRYQRVPGASAKPTGLYACQHRASRQPPVPAHPGDDPSREDKIKSAATAQ